MQIPNYNICSLKCYFQILLSLTLISALSTHFTLILDWSDNCELGNCIFILKIQISQIICDHKRKRSPQELSTKKINKNNDLCNSKKISISLFVQIADHKEVLFTLRFI